MAKDTCEAALKLSINLLKKHGYLNNGYHSGTITWSSSNYWSNQKNSVRFDTYINEGNVELDTYLNNGSYLHLYYTNTDYCGVKTNANYRVELTVTSCFFGGKRYWFICPITKNGTPCQRRVGVLYGAGKYFGCRRCHDLAYQSQQKTHSGMFYVINKYLFNKNCEKEAALRVKYWHGEPTKRYRRLLNKIVHLPSFAELRAVTEKLEKSVHKSEQNG